MTVLRSNVAVKADEVMENPALDKIGCRGSEKAEAEHNSFVLAAYRRQRDKIIMWDEV